MVCSPARKCHRCVATNSSARQKGLFLVHNSASPWMSLQNKAEFTHSVSWMQQISLYSSVAECVRTQHESIHLHTWPLHGGHLMVSPKTTSTMSSSSKGMQAQLTTPGLAKGQMSVQTMHLSFLESNYLSRADADPPPPPLFKQSSSH